MEPLDVGERRPLVSNRVNTNHTDVTRDQMYVTYSRRWYILLVVFILSFSNSALWISFSPVADAAANFYKETLGNINWFSLIYPLAALPFSFVASWVLDTWGLRSGIIVSSLINLLGAGVRFLSTQDIISPQWRFTTALSGQGLAAIAQPIYLIIPAKLAAVWFKEDQRATANMIASMANPLGILGANLLSPYLVHDENDIPRLMLIYIIPAGVGAGLAVLGVCSSSPPSPPTASAEEHMYPYIKGLKKCLKNLNFWILMLCFGLGVGLFSSLSSLLEQILCPWGYDDVFAGICGGLMIGCGVFGAAIAGAIADKSKKFEETAKVAFCMAALVCIPFALFFYRSHMNIVLGVCVGAFGFFGFALYPISLELGVECTFPVAEATSSGLLVLSGQALTTLLILAMQWLAPAMSSSDPHSCGGQEPQNYQFALYGFTCLAVLGCLVFTIFFRCPYKRLKTEEQITEERFQCRLPSEDLQQDGVTPAET